MSTPVERLGERLAGRFGRRTPPEPAEDYTSAERETRARRDRLARDFAELQYDLGGLTYEMAIRDHFRVDLLVRRAARLQEVDAELGEAERLLKLDQAGAAGSCKSCGALHARGALYCWCCGEALMERAPDS